MRLRLWTCVGVLVSLAGGGGAGERRRRYQVEGYDGAGRVGADCARARVGDDGGVADAGLDGSHDAAETLGALEEGDACVREAAAGVECCCKTGDAAAEYGDTHGWGVRMTL